MCSSDLNSSKIGDSAKGRRVGPKEAINSEPGLENLGAQDVQRRDANFDRCQMIRDLPMIRDRLRLGAFGSSFLGQAKRCCLGVGIEL